MIRILASIVLFNPDICLLKKCLSSIIGKVDHIRFVDNDSKNKNDIATLIKDVPSSSILWNKKNDGLSKAYNALIDYAQKNNYSHLLILDQDSIPSKNFIDEYKRHISDDYTCITPLLTSQSNQNLVEPAPSVLKEEIQHSINSGTLINIHSLPPTIKFEEKLFVDWIDIDFFIQLKKLKKKVLRVNTASLCINVGDKKKHHFFNYTWYSSEYSAFRLNKQAQDTIIFLKKHKLNSENKKHYVLILWIWFMMFFFENNKTPKSLAIFSGLLSGIFKH